MIHIISGTCGTSKGLKNSKSGWFDLPPKEEARLVRRKVAEYATVPVTSDPAPVATPQEPNTEPDPCVDTPKTGNAAEGQETAFLDPEQLSAMKLAELKALADEMGVDASGCKTKAEYVNAISAEEVIPGPTIEGPVV